LIAETLERHLCCGYIIGILFFVMGSGGVVSVEEMVRVRVFFLVCSMCLLLREG